MTTISAVDLEERLRRALPDGVTYASVRLWDERAEYLAVERNVLRPPSTVFDVGVMFSVWQDGGLGYGATNDLSDAGLAAAAEDALRWARATAGIGVVAEPPFDHPTGVYNSPVSLPIHEGDLSERIDLLMSQSQRMQVDDRVVDWAASLSHRNVDTLLLTSEGGRIEQQFRFVYPGLRATANEGTNTQSRTFGRNAFCGQGGLELLDRYGFGDAAPQIAAEAVELLDAPNCPTGTMDVVLAPDQMILQIHESIGHPLELDRILGDERNYAGTSFVTPDMFGSYRYGSDKLNVTFDPTVEGQLASYGFDDDGTPAEKQYLIRNGILERPLGGATSSARAGLDGVANSRSCSWNRPPIDRMANLNIEPGDETLEEMIGSISDGVYFQTNNSWSIDDSRNKFQFSCEFGTRIENGELTHTVRNPSYRGISSEFWRSLDGVGNADTFTVMGTPNCGKGELNQTIGTGHASPPCLFRNIEVFGADE